MSAGRKILVISAAFPPTGGPGVQRTAKFVKYLPRCGWTPIVWALEAMRGLPRDDTLLADVPKTATVHRMPLAGVTKRGVLSVRLGEWLRGSPLPDGCAAWVEKSTERLCQLVAYEKVAAIYSTYSPASNHLLALRVRQRTGVAWVADFRDPWTDDFRYEERCAARRDAHRLLEQQILEGADAVLGVSDGQTELLARHAPDRRSRFSTITNGYDPDDFGFGCADVPAAHELARREPFTLAHVGRLDQRRSGVLIEALRLFAANQSHNARFRLRVAGHCAPSTRRALLETGATCEFAAYMPHGAAIREMCQATALLLCVGTGANAATAIPGKLFEYLAAGRPILAVGDPAGDAARIVERCGAGAVCPADPNSVSRALTRLYDAWAHGDLQAGCPRMRLRRFSRVQLTQRLAEILDRLSGHSEAMPQMPALEEACA